MDTSRGFLFITYKLYHHLSKLEGEHKSHCLNVFLSVMKYAWKKNGYEARLRHETIHKDTGLCRTTIKSCLSTLNKLNVVKSFRGKSGKTYGNLFSMLTILKGLPISYFKDLQDDKEIIFNSSDTLLDCLKVFEEVLKNISPNKKRMLELANSGYITATDLADYLVKNHSMSFRKAYQKTAAIVNLAEKNKKKLNELTLEEFKKIEPKLTKDVLKVFDIKNSVNSKKSYGGTAFDNIKKMIIKYKN